MLDGVAGIFVTGTDTGVGKTVLTAALAYALTRAGRRVAAMKPVQTGSSDGRSPDLEFIEKALGRSQDPALACPNRLRYPLAPMVAAQLQGEIIETNRIWSAFSSLQIGHELVLVEGAGGLLVPLAARYTMADLAVELGLPVLIAARPGLGTINHTGMTVECARQWRLKVLGFVLVAFPDSPDLAERTNPEVLLRQTGVPLLGVLPYDAGLSVDDGRLGGLPAWAPRSLSPELGGTFNPRSFLEGLRASPNAS